MAHHDLDRREFLRLGLCGISAASTFPLFIGKTAAATARAGHPEDDRILVVLQLSGGNDGLNTVVPYGDPVYGRVRSTLRIPEKDVLHIDGYVGLHPNLKDLKAHLKDLYQDIRSGTIPGIRKVEDLVVP